MQSGEFVLAIAASTQQKLANQLGSLRGEKVDRIDRLCVPAGCAAWMLCRVDSLRDINGYRLVIGRVEDRKDLEARPLVWQGGGL